MTTNRKPENPMPSSPSSPSLSSKEESFADMLDSFSPQKYERVAPQKRWNVGDRVSGTIVRIGKEYLFVDIGAKAEARMALHHSGEQTDHDGFQVGDRIEARIISTDTREGGFLIGRYFGREKGGRTNLTTAFEQKIPVEGKVTAVNKGGLDMDIGGTRAFLPVSQIDTRHTANPESYLGQTLRVLITQYEQDPVNVVVSRKLVLESENQSKLKQIQPQLVPGATFQGMVTAVQEYGAFVDLGGIEGFLHVSEIGYGREIRAKEVMKPGDRVDVVVLKVEESMGGNNSKTRISLSMKALLVDPFQAWVLTAEEGQKIHGRVVRLEPFGAFVELEKGIEGLIHISAMVDHPIKHSKDVLQLGQEVTATIVRLDREQRKIGLSLTEDAKIARRAAIEALTLGDIITVVVEKIEPYGILVRIPGQTGGSGAAPKGLIPNGEIPQAAKTEIKRQFPVGKEIKALIQRIDPSGKVQLSIKAVLEAEERSSIASYQPQNTSLGKVTLGDLLKQKGLLRNS